MQLSKLTFIFLKCSLGDCRVRADAALIKDLGSNPRTHMCHSILLHFQRIQHPLLVSVGISSVCSGHCIDADAHTSTLKLNKYFKSPLFFLYNTIHPNTLLDIIQMLSQLSVFLLSVLYDARLSHSLVSLTSHLFIDSVISYCRLNFCLFLD